MANQRENVSSKEKYVTLPLLYEKLETITAQNRAEHQEIRLEISRGLAEMKDTTSHMNERLVRIEASPAHEKFQTQFCPNTKEIAQFESWIHEHKDVHKEIIEQLQKCENKIDGFLSVIRDDRKDFAAERMKLQIDGITRMKWTIIGIALTGVGSVVVALILHAIGLT